MMANKRRIRNFYALFDVMNEYVLCWHNELRNPYRWYTQIPKLNEIYKERIPEITVRQGFIFIVSMERS